MVSLLHLSLSLMSAQTNTSSEIAGVITDQFSTAVKGTAVTLLSLDHVHQTTTGGDGTFHFVGVEPGSYTLEAKAPGFLKKSVPLTLASGESPQNIEMVLDVSNQPETGTCGREVAIDYQALDASGASVSGILRDYVKRKPISKANITFEPESARSSRVVVQSDAVGRFRALHLPPDYYDIQISRSGYNTEDLKHVVVPPENKVLIESTLLKTGQLIACQ